LSWSWPRFLESLETFQGGAAKDRIEAKPVSQTVQSQTLVAVRMIAIFRHWHLPTSLAPVVRSLLLFHFEVEATCGNIR
jgi:hypothetical protein